MSVCVCVCVSVSCISPRNICRRLLKFSAETLSDRMVCKTASDFWILNFFFFPYIKKPKNQIWSLYFALFLCSYSSVVVSLDSRSFGPGFKTRQLQKIFSHLKCSFIFFYPNFIIPLLYQKNFPTHKLNFLLNLYLNML